MISLTSVVYLVLYLLIAGLVFYVLWWLVNYFNPPEPFRKIITAILVILAALVVISALLSLIGATPIIRFP